MDTDEVYSRRSPRFRTTNKFLTWCRSSLRDSPMCVCVYVSRKGQNREFRVESAREKKFSRNGTRHSRPWSSSSLPLSPPSKSFSVTPAGTRWRVGPKRLVTVGVHSTLPYVAHCSLSIFSHHPLSSVLSSLRLRNIYSACKKPISAYPNAE